MDLLLRYLIICHKHSKLGTLNSTLNQKRYKFCFGQGGFRFPDSAWCLAGCRRERSGVKASAGHSQNMPRFHRLTLKGASHSLDSSPLRQPAGSLQLSQDGRQEDSVALGRCPQRQAQRFGGSLCKVTVSAPCRQRRSLRWTGYSPLRLLSRRFRLLMDPTVVGVAVVVRALPL